MRLEFPMLSLTPGLGTVAWRLTSARRGLADEGPPAHPALPGRHDREAVWPRWRVSGDRGAFSAQAAADRRAPFTRWCVARGGGAAVADSKVLKFRIISSDKSADLGASSRRRLRLPRQKGDELILGLEPFLLVDDGVAVVADQKS